MDAIGQLALQIAANHSSNTLAYWQPTGSYQYPI